MQNPNSSENLDSSTRPGLGSNHYSHPASKAPATGSSSTAQPHLPASQAHGYVDAGLDAQPHIHPHFASAQTGVASGIMHRANSSTSEELGSSTSPNSSSMAAQAIIGHEPDDSTTDGRKAKRELSQSKRAAQNRAAQRAFRQRKEHYIKKLEQQVKDYTEMEHTYKAIQNDNYALREYVIQLQSRLLDLQVELPQPPPNVNIAPPGPPSASRQPHGNPQVDAPQSATSAGTLADVAAAVAGLRAREPVAEGSYAKSSFKTENSGPSHPNDELRRQLQADGLPPPPTSTLRT
ncbi:putative bZIP transcription factor [Rosellinia necatrix]|uniref:Putative transcription factor kapC n=1 Tax=Rosellinia necatrix TaxID=77044 RepID=A0A1W2TPM3_ROSNE|nr:putative bZIP transcription factor [Rosellinia necatrix]